MATLKTNLPDICFPADVDILCFSSETTETKVEVKLLLENVCVFETVLIPDVEGDVVLSDIAVLLSDYLVEFRAYSLEIIADDETKAPIKLLPCSVNLNMQARNFIMHRFLTLLDGDKTIPLTALETLYWYEDNEEGDAENISQMELQIKASWWDDTEGKLLQKTASKPIAATSQGCYQADVSPSTLTAPSGHEQARLLRYSVRCGRREQNYVVVPVTSIAVRFQNAFGVMETFHFWGYCENEQKLERSQASFSGKLRTYLIEDSSEIKIYSGMLPDSAIPAIRDLARSKNITFFPDETPVVISSSEIKTRSDNEAFNEANITFRQSSHLDIVRLHSHKRTFDETFDDTFY